MNPPREIAYVLALYLKRRREWSSGAKGLRALRI